MVIRLFCPDAKGPITWQILAWKWYPLKIKVVLIWRTFQPRLKILAWSFSHSYIYFSHPYMYNITDYSCKINKDSNIMTSLNSDNDSQPGQTDWKMHVIAIIFSAWAEKGLQACTSIIVFCHLGKISHRIFAFCAQAEIEHVIITIFQSSGWSEISAQAETCHVIRP